MIFDPNQTEFLNDSQRAVWMYGTHIVPLEVSLKDIDDEETREGCTQIYDCSMEILEDLYNHSDEIIENPRWYLGDYLLWLITGDKPNKKHREEYERFLKRIPKYGFVYDEALDSWSNDRYPLFFEYFIRLAALAKERKQNLGGYFRRCDFRLFAKQIKLTMDDLLRPLSNVNSAYALSVHEYAVSSGMKMQMKDPYLFRYIYKKLYSLEISNNPFRIEISYRLDNGKHVSDQYERFMSIVEKEPDSEELIRYIQGGACVCNSCSGTKKVNQRCGKWVELNGVRRLLSKCHPAIGKIRRGPHNTAYTDYDIKMLKRMIDIRIEQIDTYLGNPPKE